MLCSEFHDLIFERLGGELSREQEVSCAEHENSCAICRAEYAQFKRVESRLRTAWPSEDPLPVSVVVAQHAAHNWFDLASVWFARASAALVMACLVAVLLLRPSIEAERGAVHIAFGRDAARPQQGMVAGRFTVSQDQLKAMVQAAVDQEIARMQPADADVQPASATGKPADNGQRVTQVALQVRQLQQSQATLWQRVQQQELYLESLWRTSGENVRPATFKH
jgi:hypothetical protein